MKNNNFLVVDDCRLVLSLVRNIITTRLGSDNIFTASNGKEALDLLEKNKIDVIISDWEMPKLSGEELLYQIRHNSRFKEIPFIMMTSLGGRDFVITAIQNGVSNYVVKPFTPEKLEKAVRKAWNGANKRDAQRYSGLPQHKLSAKLDGKNFHAKLLNISSTGAQFSMKFSKEVQLFSSCELDLKFEKASELGITHLGPIKGRVVRIEAENSFHPSSLQCEVALYFASDSHCKEVEESLAQLFAFLNAKTRMIT